ncbi:hypothetical protein GCM10025734_79070 [Kitasatospora paranensis]|uniref:alpha/beta hydrolase n=1 Tax=Kitasatospora paranensis TaxID=258053 RepID=UPI0031E50EC7
MDLHLAPVPPRPAPDGGRVFEGLSYALREGFRPLLLDLHVPPAGGGPAPVVVWIHGGAFLSGDRRHLPETLTPGSLFEAFTAAGIAVATIDYRLSGEAVFPAQLDDVRSAIAYLRYYADVLGIDTGRLGASGESAGGALAALAALTPQVGGGPGEASPPGIAAAVLWYPVTDLALRDATAVDSPEAKLLGGAPAELPEQAAAAGRSTR